MLPTDNMAVAQVARIAPTHGAADPRQQAFQRALAPLLGKALHGEIQAKLSDGSFAVKIADIAIRMQLPQGSKVGTDLPLMLVSVQPRPTFQVGAGTNPVFSEAGPPLPEGADPAQAPLCMRAGSAAQGGSAVGRAALLQATAVGSAVQSFGAQANTTVLSQAGKTIGGVLAAARNARTPMTAVLGRTPVVAAAGMDVSSIAAGLQQAVGKSGLFYESHVAEWAQGARPLAELNAEPQQQLAREGVRQHPLDPATAQFITLQLATQEQAHLAWQGNLWPGQRLQLDVQRDTREGHEEAGEDDTPWHSRLRLRFPLLGELDARLSLAGDRLQVQFAAGSEDSAALLRRHLDSLAGALDAAGMSLTGFEVHTLPDDD